MSEYKKMKMTNNVDLCNKGINEIPDSILHSSNIEELNLCENEISIIPNKIKNLLNLKKLYLNINNILIIEDGIEKLTNLKDLNLHMNRLYNISNILITCLIILVKLSFKITTLSSICCVNTPVYLNTRLK